MLTAGIMGSEGKLQTANLINSILSSTGKKISVVDSKNLLGFDKKRIRAYIYELENNNTDILLLKLDISDVEKFLSNEMHFDIIIYTGKSDDASEDENSTDAVGKDKVMLLLADKGIAIVNEDDNGLINLFQGIKHPVVTYGFNTKASVTTSSIGDELYKNGFICCLQKTISANNGTIIEPQEYKLKLDSNEIDSHNVLAAASFAIVNGIDLNNMTSAQV
jgi:UDP-N-acetylmuramate-alanine ligase